jgi:hypothetical protein
MPENYFFFITTDDWEDLNRKAKELNFSSFFEIVNIIGYGLLTGNKIIIDFLITLDKIKKEESKNGTSR